MVVAGRVQFRGSCFSFGFALMSTTLFKRSLLTAPSHLRLLHSTASRMGVTIEVRALCSVF